MRHPGPTHEGARTGPRVRVDAWARTHGAGATGDDRGGESDGDEQLHDWYVRHGARFVQCPSAAAAGAEGVPVCVYAIARRSPVRASVGPVLAAAHLLVGDLHVAVELGLGKIPARPGPAVLVPDGYQLLEWRQQAWSCRHGDVEGSACRVLERRVDQALQRLDDRFGAAGILDAGGQRDELVPVQVRDEQVRADGRLEPPPDLAQDVVADLMAVVVVHALEAVQVEIQEASIGLGPVAAGKIAPVAIEQVPRRQPGLLVVAQAPARLVVRQRAACGEIRDDDEHRSPPQPLEVDQGGEPGDARFGAGRDRPIDPGEDRERLVRVPSGPDVPQAEAQTLLDGDRHSGPDEDRPEVAKLDRLDREHPDGQHHDGTHRRRQAADRVTGEEVGGRSPVAQGPEGDRAEQRDPRGRSRAAEQPGSHDRRDRVDERHLPGSAGALGRCREADRDPEDEPGEGWIDSERWIGELDGREEWGEREGRHDHGPEADDRVHRDHGAEEATMRTDRCRPTKTRR